MQHESIPIWKLIVGVAGGILLADLIRMAFAALALGALIGSWGLSTQNPGEVTERGFSRPRRVQAESVPALHGPITARDLGVSRACINATIVDRKNNGWAQDLENNRPQPCQAKSP